MRGRQVKKKKKGRRKRRRRRRRRDERKETGVNAEAEVSRDGDRWKRGASGGGGVREKEEVHTGRDEDVGSEGWTKTDREREREENSCSV